ncbi:MAG: DUF3352 domain-containing protein [Bernardetiaceae bacterium]|jgi:hypothetical protein|nr:DUF3352 domain-containing protein [Bernardetiaceae bacterium]
MKRLFYSAVLLLVVWVAVWYFITPPAGYLRPIQAVPRNAIYVLETDQPMATWQAIVDNPTWRFLRGQPYFAQLTATAHQLNERIAQNPNLAKLVGSRTVLVSAHPYPRTGYEFLFTVDLGEASRFRFVEDLWTKISLPNYVISSSNYNGFIINGFSDKKTGETVHVAFVGNLLLASYQSLLVKAAIDQREQPTLADDPHWQQLTSEVGGGGLFKCYLQYAQLPALAQTYSPGPNEWVNMLQRDLSFSGLSFEPEDGGQLLVLQGYTHLQDSLDSYFKATLRAGRGRLGAQRVIPQGAAYYLSFAFADFPTFFNHAEQIYLKDPVAGAEYRNGVQSLERLLKINLKDHFVSWVGDEVALVQTQPQGQGRTDEMAAVLKVADLDKARENLAFIEEQVRKRTPGKFTGVDYQGYQIRYLAIKDFFRLLLGKLFAKLDKPYYTLIDNYVIFSNHPETLKRIIRDYQAGQTLAQDADFDAFLDNFNTSSSVFAYVQTPMLYNLLPGLVARETWSSVRQNRPYVVSFSQIGFQLGGNDDRFDTKMAVRFDSTRAAPPSVLVADAGQATEADLEPHQPKIQLKVEGGELPIVVDQQTPGEDPIDIEITDVKAKKQQGHYPDGSLKYDLETRDGFKHGLYHEYYPPGTIKMSGRYRNDQRDGVWRYYHANGKLRKTVRYRDGEAVSETEEE